MGKLEDIPGLGETIHTPPSEADEFLYYLEGLVDEPHVQYGRDTIEGIMETVQKTGRVTENQRAAVDNIDEGGQRGQYKYD